MAWDQLHITVSCRLCLFNVFVAPGQVNTRLNWKALRWQSKEEMRVQVELRKEDFLEGLTFAKEVHSLGQSHYHRPGLVAASGVDSVTSHKSFSVNAPRLELLPRTGCPGAYPCLSVPL